MKEVVVSVICPLYRAGRWAHDLAQSISGQDFDRFEVVLVSDGCPDESHLAVANALHASGYSGDVKLCFSQANFGPAHACNLGVAHASGEFLAFHDQDDYWPPNRLSAQVAHISESREHLEASVVMTLEVTEYLEPLRESPTNKRRRNLNAVTSARALLLRQVVANQIKMGGVLIRRNAYNLLGGKREEFAGGEDWELWFNFFASGMRVRALDAQLHHWRRHGEQTSNGLRRRIRSYLVRIPRVLAHFGSRSRAASAVGR